MRTSHPFRAAVVVAAAIALTPDALAQQVRLRTAHEVGEHWSFELETLTTIGAEVRTAGQPNQRFDRAERAAQRGRFSVTSVHDGWTTGVVVRYGDAWEETRDGADAWERRDLPVSGCTFTVTRDPESGDVRMDPAPAKEDYREVLDILSDLIDPDEGFLPDDPVAVGDRWVATEKAIAKALDLGAEDRGTARCKLTEIVQRHSRETARVAMQVVVVKKLEGFMDAELDLEGSVAIDVRTGRMVEIALEGPFSLRGETVVPADGGEGTAIEVRGAGKLSFTLRLTPEKSPVTPEAPAAPAGPRLQPRPTANGGASAPPVANPSAPAPDLSTPEKAWEALRLALEASDFEAFRALHTEAVRERMTRDDFERGRELLARHGPPPVTAFEPLDDGGVRLRLANGRSLTVLRCEAGAWRADSVWTH